MSTLFLLFFGCRQEDGPGGGFAVYVVPVVAFRSGSSFGVVIACGIGKLGIVRTYTHSIPITLCAGVVYSIKAIARIERIRSDAGNSIGYNK